MHALLLRIEVIESDVVIDQIAPQGIRIKSRELIASPNAHITHIDAQSQLAIEGIPRTLTRMHIHHILCRVVIPQQVNKDITQRNIHHKAWFSK